MHIGYFSNTGDGAWHFACLLREGHTGDWFLKDWKYADTLSGIVPPPKESLEDPSKYDLIVFDDSTNGKLADEFREVTPVIGSSAFADEIEHDRLAGIEFMEACGIPVPPYESFNDIGKATDWLNKTGKRCVFKPFGDRVDCATTYVSRSAEDMIDYMEKLTSKVKVKEFLLQEFVEGTEVSTEGYFNGERFFAVNHTLEEKKFLSGGLGPNTGCSGNVLWMPIRNTSLFERGLRRSASLLGDAGFVGPIDLNAIVTGGKLFGLEWTPRFGYEGTCNLMRLLPSNFGDFMLQIATGRGPETLSAKANFAAAIRITVPPYPNPSDPKKYAGVPVKGIDLDHIECCYLSDVKLNEQEELETIGTDGLVGAPIGCADTIKQAFTEVERYIKRLHIPDLQWRDDCAKCCEKRYLELERDGWLRSAEAVSA